MRTFGISDHIWEETNKSRGPFLWLTSETVGELLHFYFFIFLFWISTTYINVNICQTVQKKDMPKEQLRLKGLALLFHGSDTPK